MEEEDSGEMPKNRQIAIEVAEIFEDFLQERNIVVPDRFREGKESEANLFGEAYWQVEDGVTDILDKKCDSSVTPKILDLFKYTLEEHGLGEPKKLDILVPKISSTLSKMCKQ